MPPARWRRSSPGAVSPAAPSPSGASEIRPRWRRSGDPRARCRRGPYRFPAGAGGERCGSPAKRAPGRLWALPAGGFDGLLRRSDRVGDAAGGMPGDASRFVVFTSGSEGDARGGAHRRQRPPPRWPHRPRDSATHPTTHGWVCCRYSMSVVSQSCGARRLRRHRCSSNRRSMPCAGARLLSGHRSPPSSHDAPPLARCGSRGGIGCRCSWVVGRPIPRLLRRAVDAGIPALQTYRDDRDLLPDLHRRPGDAEATWGPPATAR